MCLHIKLEQLHIKLEALRGTVWANSSLWAQFYQSVQY